MIKFTVSSYATLFSAVKSAVFTGVKNSLLLTLSVALVFQFVFFTSEASAAFGKQSGGLTVDQAIKKSEDNSKEMKRDFNKMTEDLKNGRGDKVVDKISESAKEKGRQDKKMGKDVGDSIKQNIDKAQNAIGDRTNEVIDAVKDSFGR